MKTAKNNGKSYLEVSKSEIKALLAFASKDSTRPQLACVYFAEEPEPHSPNIDDDIGRTLTGKAVAVATDGHTIIQMTSGKRSGEIASPFEYLPPVVDPATLTLRHENGFMVPREDLERVGKMLTGKTCALLDFRLNAEGRKIVTISANGAEMIVRCVDAKYVPYHTVIPAQRTETTSSICGSVGISAKYLARLELVTDALDLSRTCGIKLQLPIAELDPLRFDAVGHETTAIVVIMPMRI